MNKKYRILVVEDENLTALEIQSKLKLWGYEVADTVSSGEDAVEKALELKPDLILMDIVLKGDITGVDAAKTIKESLNIPIIYLTAYSNDEIFQGAKITRPYAYLIKPFEEKELKFAIEMAFYSQKFQNKLEESEERYRQMAEKAQDLIFIINSHYLVDYVNKASLKYLKLSPEDAIGLQFEDVFPHQKFQQQKKALRKVFLEGKSLRTGDTISFSDCELWMDTRLTPLKDDNGLTYAVLGISRKVTEPRRILMKLQAVPPQKG
jgi:two-component system, response regulator PdtaR